MNISVIIPNYNGEKILEKNLSFVLEALSDYKNGKVELIVSDDKSTDNSLHILNAFKKQNERNTVIIKILISETNKGFSSNVNKGVQAARGEIVILLNTDVIPSKYFLNPLLKHFSNEKVFGVGCMDESVEEGKIVLRGRGVGKWEKGLLVHRAGSLDKNNSLWVSGGSGAFRKDIWDKLGGLNSLYDPFYWEDIDLSYRALKSGYSIIFERESIVRHEHEKGVIKSKYKENTIKKVAYRNQFIFSWINADRRNLILNLFWIPIFMIKSLWSKDLLLLAGLFEASKNLHKILRSRRTVKKLFIKSDKDIILELDK